MILSNQNRRTESTIYQEENKKLKQENKELLRYKKICEELKSRQKELDLEVAQYRLGQQTNLKRNSQDISTNIAVSNVEYEKLKNNLIKEKEISNSLKKELASCVSRFVTPHHLVTFIHNKFTSFIILKYLLCYQ